MLYVPQPLFAVLAHRCIQRDLSFPCILRETHHPLCGAPTFSLCFSGFFLASLSLHSPFYRTSPSFSSDMTQSTPFLGTPAIHDFDHLLEGGEDIEWSESDDFTFGWIRIRVLSHREAEDLGMWAASLKIMAGTQRLLPTVPTILPFSRRRSRPSPRPYSCDPSPSDPPSSPVHTPSSRTMRDGETPARGVLQEASAACTKIMRLAQTLERRTNAERRLSRKNRLRAPLASVARPAAPSTVPAVSDDMSCRAATAHPPRPSASIPLDLVGVLVDVPPSPLPLPTDNSPSPRASASRTYVDMGTDSLPVPTSRDVGVDASPPCRSFSDATVGNEGSDTTYGAIADPFARDLARLLPWCQERERVLAQTIWLADWESQIEIFEKMPPFLRVYLHALFMLFRPKAHPAQRASIPPGFAPVCNLFTHWWCAWNALSTPYGPPEADPHRRYYHLTHEQICGGAPLEGRGYILEHASLFL